MLPKATGPSLHLAKKDGEESTNIPQTHSNAPVQGSIDPNHVIIPDPTVGQTQIFPLKLLPSEHNILGAIQSLTRNDVPVSTSTVFAQLIRKGGLPDSKTPIYEEETILAMANSLVQAITKGHPYNTCKEAILKALLAIPNKTLRQWKKGPIFIREKACILGQEPRKSNPLEPQPPILQKPSKTYAT